jgi:hypothetical protein
MKLCHKCGLLIWENEEPKHECKVKEVVKMKGNDIVSLIEEWLTKQGVHENDFDMMFAKELLDLMDKD